MIATLPLLLAAALAGPADPPVQAAPAPITAPSPVAAPAPAPASLSQIAADQARAYEASLRSAIQSAQSAQGPLDGGWLLVDGSGQRLYRFEFSDRGVGLGLAEGAWRDLRVAGAAQGSGFITSIATDGSKLMLRFYELGASDLAVVTVSTSGPEWTGELWYRGAVTPVSLRRD